jgi:hypothetical protein
MATRVGVTVGQFCDVLEIQAKRHERLGLPDIAEGLRSVSNSLKPHERAALSKLVDDVKKLRTSGGKKVRRGRESA